MIKVNLLPLELRPIKRTPLPYFAIIAVAALIAVVLFSVFGTGATKILRKNGELATAKAELADLQPTVDRYNELSKQKLGLQTKLQVIEEILSDRIIWSKQLHKLTALTPDNIWYSSFKIVVQSYTGRRPKLDPKGQVVEDATTKRPVMENFPAKRSVLEISGYAIQDSTGSQNIAQLTKSTTTDPDFSKMFVLNPPKFEPRTFGPDNIPVRYFTLDYLIKTGTEEE